MNMSMFTDILPETHSFSWISFHLINYFKSRESFIHEIWTLKYNNVTQESCNFHSPFLCTVTAACYLLQHENKHVLLLIISWQKFYR